MAGPADFQVDETLRNGARVTFRAIRAEDRDRMREAYRRLSPEAQYLRSFTYKNDLSDAELRRLTEVDFEREVALVVLDGETVVGGARYVRDGDAAEVAFTVDTGYRGLGLAGLLLKHLASIARTRGLKRFTAEVLAENAAMLTVFARSGLPMQRRRESGVVHVTMDLASR